MDRHFLVAVSEQKSASYGIQFVGHFFSNKEGLKLTLFYTVPRPTEVWSGERTLESDRLRERQARAYEARGREALESARQALVDFGFKEIDIEKKLQFRQFSKVKDIIQEGAGGLYDAVVLGRRGLSVVEEILDESVSKDLLETRVNFPIWACRRPDLDRKNVLVCVDGSDCAYRMADHVGFMLGREENHEVTLLLIVKKSGHSEERAEAILDKGRAQIMGHGVPAERIKTKKVTSGNAAGAALKEAEAGRYAAVAVGRTGKGQGLMGKWFMGSVSQSLFRHLEGVALWVCY